MVTVGLISFGVGEGVLVGVGVPWKFRISGIKASGCGVEVGEGVNVGEGVVVTDGVHVGGGVALPFPCTMMKGPV